jgi:hypothetical protein
MTWLYVRLHSEDPLVAPSCAGAELNLDLKWLLRGPQFWRDTPDYALRTRKIGHQRQVSQCDTAKLTPLIAALTSCRSISSCTPVRLTQEIT